MVNHQYESLAFSTNIPIAQVSTDISERHDLDIVERVDGLLSNRKTR